MASKVVLELPDIEYQVIERRAKKAGKNLNEFICEWV